MSMQLPKTAEFVGKDGRRTMAIYLRRWLLGAAVALGGGMVVDAAPGAPAEPPLVGNLRSWNLRQTPIVEAVKRVRDAVVNIHSERAVRPAGADELFSGNSSQGRVNGMGTGILIDPRGYIVTNQHVVEDVALIRVRLADGTASNARVVARDSECDLALLKIDVDHPLPTLTLGTTRDLMVGETVFAIGNAYGYEHTVTVGVVSAVSRDVSLNKEMSYKSLIQTDASINPGNSGGPLLNLHGELIGVNVAIRAGAQGIGFAIPVDTMIRVAGRMLASRAPQGGAHGRLGLLVKDDVHLAPPGSGPGETASLRRVVVDRVDAGSLAARAGLERGDILLAVGDTSINASLDLERALFDRQGGERVSLRFRRNGQEKTTEIALDSSSSVDLIWQKLGLRLQPVGADAVRIRPVAGSDALRENSRRFRGGLMVAEVRADSPADRAGVQRGDILVGLHEFEMLSNDNVHYVLNQPEIAGAQPLKFFVLRDSRLQHGKLQIDE
ncbi:MAG: S1C family serine protease [Gemmataceae bacterium]